MMTYAESKGVDVMTLDSILKEMFESLDPNPNYDSEVLQVLRMLKVYEELGRLTFPKHHPRVNRENHHPPS